MTDPLGQSQVIPYLAGLSAFDYDFTILSCDKPDRYKKHKKYVLELLKPHNIKWVSLPYHKSPTALSSIYDYYNLRRHAAKLHKAENFDIVHPRPGVPSLVGLWLKKKYGIKILNDVRGFWADERMDGGMWNLKNPVFKTIYHFFKRHEFECINLADYNTCLTYSAKKEIQSWKNVFGQPKTIEVIPCSVDLALFDPENINPEIKNKLRSELGITDDDFVVSYLGSIGGWYLTSEMMQFCKQLCEKIPNVKFLFISPHQHDLIKETAGKFGIAADKIIVRQGQRHEVPALLSFSKYSIFFIKACYSKISSSPTKHGEIMAMGIPVITNAGVGDVEDIVTKYNSGIVVTNLNSGEYAKAISVIASGKTFNRKAIRQGAIEFYNLETAVQKYHEVYKKILND